VYFTDVTERKERETELRRYETIFETVQDKLYVVDSDGYIELVSQPLAEAVGHTIDSLRGKHVSEFLTDEAVADGERRILDLLVTPESASSTYEGTLRSHDGDEIPVEIELSLLPYEDRFRGTVGAVRDISQRRQREEELHVFQQALTEAGIGLAMYNESGCFEYVNHHYARMLGLTRDGMEGASVWETFEHLSQRTFGSYWGSFVPEETKIEEVNHRRDDGSAVPVETVTTAVEVDGTSYRILTVREITERRERRQQSEVLHRLIRHNLRNDLTVILGHAGILEEDLDGANAEAAATVKETADRLQGLTDTAQDAQDIIGRDTLRKPVDAAALLRDEIEILRDTYEVSVETELPRTRYVLADTTLRRAFQQLLTNAVEHADSAVPAVSVRIRTTPDRSDWVTVEIADDGPGIPEHEIATLTAGEETGLQHGSGIGLWIVHWVVTRYGDLEFERPDEGGSLVRIKLPVATRESGKGQDEPSERSDSVDELTDS